MAWVMQFGQDYDRGMAQATWSWVSQATPDEPGGHEGLGKQVQAVPKVSWKSDRLVGHLLRAR